MALFDVPVRGGKSDDLAIAKKTKAKAKPTTTTIKGGGGIAGQVSAIVSMVESKLGHLRDETLIIRDIITLVAYIDKAIEYGELGVDTETMGLDPIKDKIVGLCLYVPGDKPAYIPINHVSYITGARVSDQLSCEQIREQLKRLVVANTKLIMFNAPFDIRVIRHNFRLLVSCYWDCSLGSRLLNENEGNGNKGLKKLHQKYVLKGVGDAFNFDSLFKGITFDKVPINAGALYAAHDPKITYELCDFQRPYLTESDPLCKSLGLEQVAWVFRNIEMPIVDVVVEMEDNGVEFDFEYNAILVEKYHKLLDDNLAGVNKILDSYATQIDSFRRQHPDQKLDTPINIASAKQLSILLYDILKIEPPDKKNPRGTGDDILEKIDIDITKAIQEYRALSKLISTYIDKLPECVNDVDGRVHCKFNQYGADTGRFSSSDPNMQNIPSHNKDIRKMFRASSGEKLIPEVDNHFEVDTWSEVKSQRGWISACNVIVGDRLEVDDTTMIIVNKIEPTDNNHILLYY